MITADARSKITGDDLDLLARCLGLSDDRLSGTSLDDLLDRPELKGFLLDGRMPGPSASLFFYVLVRHALMNEGIDDRILADYYAAILRDFGVRRRANQIGEFDDHEHHYLIDILNDLAHSTGDRHFRVSAHLGNYALWLTGLFPDRIEARRTRRGGPGLGYYETMGQRGFAEAGEHRLAEWSGLEEIFVFTGTQFPTVRKALNRVRGDLRLAA